MDRTTYGLDIAKNVMQLHWVEAETGEIGRKKLARAKLAAYFAQLQPVRIVMEACGSAHHWARVFTGLGHQVELLPAAQVRPFVRSNKDDAADARAIWLAEQRAAIDEQIPVTMRSLVDGQLQTLAQIGERIDALQRQIAALQEQLEGARELDQVPGIGVLGSTTLAATLGDAKAWRSGREFSASLGLVPAHAGTGGRVRIGHLSKHGDPYPRTLLIHGARSVIKHAKTKLKWLEQLLVRRPKNVVVVALANKMARTAWALIAHGRAYQRDWQSARPGSAVAQAAGA